MRQRPIGVDLFAGAGGLSRGFEQAGFDVLAAVEYDPIHAATHEYNFPGCATICRGVADIDGDYVTKWHRFRQVGNSVPPLLWQAVASKIMYVVGSRAQSEDPRGMGGLSLLEFNVSNAAAHCVVPATVIQCRIRRSEAEKAHA